MMYSDNIQLHLFLNSSQSNPTHTLCLNNSLGMGSSDLQYQTHPSSMIQTSNQLKKRFVTAITLLALLFSWAYLFRSAIAHGYHYWFRLLMISLCQYPIQYLLLL